MNNIIILVIMGLLAGGLSGLLGIGGGVILIPALIYFLGFSEHQAIGTSLAVLLPPIGVFAAYNYYKAGQINLADAAVLAAMFMVGSYFTSKFALEISEVWLRRFFSIFLIIIALKMLLSK